MPRIPLLLLSLMLGVACAWLVSCGGGSDSKKLLPGDTAKQLIQNLGQVQSLVDEGSCDSAQTAAGEGLVQAQQLPASVDPDLKLALTNGFERLQHLTLNECSVETTQTETTEAETTETATVTTTATTAPPTTPPTTPPTETTPPPTTPSDGGGGGDTDGGGTGAP
jgi:hypothetical protein